jgi:ATP-dependent Clp protease ATP-binding subunit ClpB
VAVACRFATPRLTGDSVIVMTSNLGAEYLAALPEDAPAAEARDQVMAVVRQAFRPEFLNRLDEIILFNRLGRGQLKDIVQIQLGHLRRLLADRRITLEISDAALAWLADAGYDPVYGARPLKRVIQRHLQDPLALMILDGRVRDGDAVKVDAEDGTLVINGASMAAAA